MHIVTLGGSIIESAVERRFAKQTVVKWRISLLMTENFKKPCIRSSASVKHNSRASCLIWMSDGSFESFYSLDLPFLMLQNHRPIPKWVYCEICIF